MPFSSKNQKFYNYIAPVYSLIDLFLKGFKKALVREINALPQGELLCMGVGVGKELKQLKKHCISGIDHSEKMLEKAKKQNPEIELKCMNAAQTNYKNETFDYIVIAHVLSTSNQAVQLLAEAERVLKKGGKILILNHFSPNNFLGILDRLFQPIAAFFQFQSCFYLASLPLKPTLQIKHIHSLDRMNYFKLITLSKND